MKNAIVKWFNAQKGYGFLVDAETKEDVFFHYSQIQMDGFKSLNEGDIVGYELGAGNNGREQAVNVVPILTLAMVLRELKKDKLHVMRVRDDKGIHGWYVVDKSNNPVTDKEMNLVELGKYAGFEIVEKSA